MNEIEEVISKWNPINIFKVLYRTNLALMGLVLVFAALKGISIGPDTILQILFACFLYIKLYFPFLGTTFLLLNIWGLVFDKKHFTRYLILVIVLSIYCLVGWVMWLVPIEGL
jgi:hypothetical protein